jgi:elongation factor Ts
VEIKATEVKALRDKTGAGMMDCKKALQEAQGDLQKAERILKELGLAAAAKRAGRATNQGRIFSQLTPDRGVLLELTCETDFVAKARDFVALGRKLAELALQKGAAAKAEDFDGQVKEAIGIIKENIELRRFKVIEAGQADLLLGYIHGEESRIGVLVKFSLSEAGLKANPRLKEVAFDLTLHAAAFAPQFLSRDRVPKDYLADQEAIFRKQAESLGKPENVLKGIVQGKLNKHLGEVCFLEQAFVKDPSMKVSKVLEGLNKEIGGKVAISDYLYYKVGEEVA